MKDSPVKITISGNKFIGNEALYGGAIFNNNSLLQFNIQDSEFANNKANYGGAIYSYRQGWFNFFEELFHCH